MKHPNRKWLLASLLGLLAIFVTVLIATRPSDVLAKSAVQVGQNQAAQNQAARSTAPLTPARPVKQNTMQQKPNKSLLAAQSNQAINPDQVILTMKAHYDKLQISTQCLPYRPSDVEVGKVVDVYAHDHFRINIPARNATLDVVLIGVSSHTQQGRAGDAKAQTESMVKGKSMLLIRGATDMRGDSYARHVVTADGLFLNYEVMRYSWPLVSTQEDDGCYSILLEKANQSQDQ
jgi:hypothetical protein